jgi:hypothetical protein
LTDEQRLDELESHIREFLRALNERLPRDQMIRERTEQIARPAQGDTEDVRRYLNEYKAAYDEGLADMYERIDANGTAILALTDDVHITEPVQEMLRLAKVEVTDVRNLLAKIDNAKKPAGFISLLVTFLAAGFRGLPRQQKIEQATTDLSAYCLLRFPPR